MKKTLSILILMFSLSLVSCSNQSKAEGKVKEFIKKFSLNPESYEPIEFLDLEETSNGYKLEHMYRIKTKDGNKEIKTHTFKLTKGMNVYVEMFESWD